MEKDKQSIFRQEIVKVSGEVAYKEYTRVKLLGKGGFANCYLTKNMETGAQCATKVISKSILANPRTKIKLENQIKVHKMLHCQYVVKFHAAFEDTSNVYVTMELCQKNNLNDYLNEKGKIPIPECQKFIYELSEGLKYIHSKKIIHRDIKLGNIFLGEKNKVKIGDFGLASRIEFEGEKKRTICGTPNYLAPEIIQGVGYGYEVDIWSVGILMYYLLIGCAPFETENLKQTYEKILRNQYTYQGVSIPNEAKDLIRSILTVNPALRPTLDEIIQSDFMKFGKLNILLQPSLLGNSESKAITQSKAFSRLPIILSYSEIKEGLVYLLSNGSRGLITPTSSLITEQNKDYVSLITKDKTDKIKRIQAKDLDEATNNTKLLLQQMKFPQSKITRDGKQNQGQFAYVRKYVINKNNFSVFRMSNQTIHFRWEDGCYGIVDKSMRVWVTDGKKEKIEIGINEEREVSKTMRGKIGAIRQFVNK